MVITCKINYNVHKNVLSNENRYRYTLGSTICSKVLARWIPRLLNNIGICKYYTTKKLGKTNKWLNRKNEKRK